MALTKVTKSGITDNAVDADKIEDGTVLAADIADGTITNAKLAGSIANDKLANSSITVNGTSISLGGSVSAGKVEWQAVKTTDFNAVAGEGYFVDTNSVGAVTATLPGSPSAGDTIAFKDYAGTFGTNSLTIARNGSNIQGVANDSLISTNRASVVLVYIDATKGWLFTNESNVADLEENVFITATGGTITTVDTNYKVHTFTGDGCFVVSAGTGPVAKVDYLVVAGGGGGGGSTNPGGGGGGGGAGGYRESHCATTSGPYTASPLATPTSLPISVTTYPVTVGGGGTYGAPQVGADFGNDSIFSTITSFRGGYGAMNGPALPHPYNPQPWNPDRGQLQGGLGGSGGGAAIFSGQGNASGNTPPVSPPQGNPGGDGGGAPQYAGGGGGGAGAAGADAPGSAAGGGGNGVTSSINGTPTTRAGGGGGGASTSGGQPGGTGGGGNGSQSGGTGGNGTTNTGGGGGAGGSPTSANGGSGGSGIVIIRYKFQ